MTIKDRKTEKKQQNFKQDYFGYEDGGKVYLFAFVIPIVSILVVSVVFSYIFHNTLLYEIVATIAMQLSIIAVCIVYSKKHKINFLKATNTNFKINWIFVVICAVGCFVSIFGFNDMMSVVDSLIEKIGYSSSNSSIQLTNGWWLVLSIFMLCVLPAIGEEFLFRGTILPALSKRYSQHVAIIFSALLFALFHENISQFVYQFLMGIVLGYASVKCNSLLYSMLIHFLNNFTIVMINYFSREQVASGGTTFIAIAIAKFVVACGILFALYLLVGYISKVIKNKSTVNKKASQTENIQTGFQTENIQPNITPCKDKNSSGMKYYIYTVIVLSVVWIIDLVMGIKGLL